MRTRLILVEAMLTSMFGTGRAATWMDLRLDYVDAAMKRAGYPC